MINIPFNFIGEAKYQNYDEIIQRIRKFDNYQDIGRDETNKYTMYSIELGTSFRPTMLITASMHGSEWQGTQYGLAFMESLRDDTFPDREFRKKLLNNFKIVFIPFVNPWGLDNTTEHAILTGRYTANGTDLNADFDEFTQSESRNVRKVMSEYKPFAYFDLHMIRGHQRDTYLILGNGQGETNAIRDEWADSWEEYTGKKVERWAGYVNLAKGLSRRYMRDQENDYTPHTLSYITEIARPVAESAGFNAPLSDEEIHSAGMASLYLFFKTSIDYFSNYNSLIDTDDDWQLNGQPSLFLQDLKGTEFPAIAKVDRKKRVNGQREISLSFLYDQKNESFIHDIEFGWKILFRGEWYTITNPSYSLDGDYFSVGVDAVLSFFVDMNGHYLQDEVEDKSSTPTAYFTELFKDTGYNYVLIDNLSSNTLNYQANQTKTERFLYGIDRFKGEYAIYGKLAYIHELIGSDKDVILHEDLNIQDVTIEVDGSGFHTWAKGFGDKDDNEEDAEYKLETEYSIPALVDKYGWIEGPAIRDGSYKYESNLKDAIKKQIENSAPTSTTITAVDLTNNGYPEMQFEEGDRVFLYVADLKQNQQVRVVEIDETFDWEGNIIDAQYTVGNEGIAARYKTQQYDTLKDFRDIASGRKTLEYNWLPEAIKRSSDIINGNIDSHFHYGAGEIIGINRSNPNGYMRFNTDGIGFSRDGGKTYDSAMTYEGINASAMVTGSFVANFIKGGILESLNGRTLFNLDTGELDMKNASFTLGSGAKINFTSRNNKIKYTVFDDEIGSEFSSGLGVGLAIGDRFPFAYMGTNSKGDLDTLSPSFSGFIANTVSRINNDDSANAVYGNRLRFINHTDYSKGLTIDFFDNPSIVPWGGNFELGDAGSRFNRVFANEVRGSQSIYIRDAYGAGGLRIDTDWGASGEGSNLGIIPLNTGEYLYNLGRENSEFTHAYVTSVHADWVNGTVVGTSTHNAKMSIEDLDGRSAFDYFNMMNVKTFFYKDSDITNPYNRKVSPIIEQLDPSLEKLYKATEDGLDINSNLFLLVSAFKHHIKETNERFKALENQDNKDEDEKINYRYRTQKQRGSYRGRGA